MKSFLMHVLLPLLVLAGGGALAYWLFQNRPVTKPAPPSVVPPLVRVIAATAQDVQLDVASQGTVQPRTQSTLSAEVAGRVEHVAPSLRAGSFFAAGDELLTIEKSEHVRALRAAEAEVARVQRQLAWEEAEAAAAIAAWHANHGEAPSELVARAPQLREAKALLASAQASRDEAQRNVDRTAVRAPYAGRVRDKRVDVGDFVTRGTVLAHVYAIDAVEVRLPLPDRELAHVDLPLGLPGSAAAPVEVTLRAAFGGQTHAWQGRIVGTEGELDAKTRAVHAIAVVDAPYAEAGKPPLVPGMFVQAAIRGRTHRGAVTLPRTALRGLDQVWLVDGEGRLRARRVDVLRGERERVILRAGVQAGERVCVTNLETPTEGMQVRVDAPAEQVKQR